MGRYKPLELDIKQALDNYATEARENNLTSNRDWTHGLKAVLGRLGVEKYGCRICTSGFTDEYDREWLYDMVWYKEEGAKLDARLVEVPLVVESEWSPHLNDMKFDFEKLLVVNASQRLFVGYVHSDNLNDRIEYFKVAVEKYLHGSRGDRFMIALLDMTTKTFFYDLIIRKKQAK